jgi:hypothetical protein
MNELKNATDRASAAAEESHSLRDITPAELERHNEDIRNPGKRLLKYLASHVRSNQQPMSRCHREEEDEFKA